MGSEEEATPGGFDSSSSGSDSVFDVDGGIVRMLIFVAAPLMVVWFSGAAV
jgi:hypothetical protein